jgi:predicted metallo-beta-lactamase superfamily hydrolase
MSVKMIEHLIKIEIFIYKMGGEPAYNVHYTLQGKMLDTLKRLEKIIQIDNKKLTLSGKLEYAVNCIEKLEEMEDIIENE